MQNSINKSFIIIIPSIFCIIVGLTLWFAFTIHPYLTPTLPVDSRILVTEGWLKERALWDVAGEFTKGQYDCIIAAGVELKGSSGIRITEVLTRFGIADSLVYTVPCKLTNVKTTRESATALKNWLLQNRPEVKSVNIITEGAHARKTYIVYKYVLEPNISAGILHTPPSGYDPNAWWKSKLGIKWVFFSVGKVIVAHLFHL